MTASLVVVDTSALMAIVLGESDAEAYAAALTRSIGVCVIAAPNVVESHIVAATRLGDTGIQSLTTVLERSGMEITTFDTTQAHLAAAAWQRFGKGRHPAALNLGDCFAYALARSLDSPLLFKGGDFSQTDIRSAL